MNKAELVYCFPLQQRNPTRTGPWCHTSHMHGRGGHGSPTCTSAHVTLIRATVQWFRGGGIHSPWHRTAVSLWFRAVNAQSAGVGEMPVGEKVIYFRYRPKGGRWEWKSILTPSPRGCVNLALPGKLRKVLSARRLPGSQWEFRCLLCHQAWPSDATPPGRLFSHSSDCFSQLLLPIPECKHIRTWFTVQNIHPEFTSSFVFGLL